MSAKLSSSDIFITETPDPGGAPNVRPCAALCGAPLNVDSLVGSAPHGSAVPEAVAPTQDGGWSLAQYAWHGERLHASRLGSEGAAPGTLLLPVAPPERLSLDDAPLGCADERTCRVAGCAAPVSRKSRGIGGRCRICELHLATPVVVLDGVQQRFCQKCCKWEPIAAFDGDARTCSAKLVAARRRRTEARQRHTAPPLPVAAAPLTAAALSTPPASVAGSGDAAAPTNASYDLEAWLSGEAGDNLMDALLSEEHSGATNEVAVAAAARAAFAVAVAGAPLTDVVQPLPAGHGISAAQSSGRGTSAPPTGTSGAPSLSCISFSVKVHNIMPDDLPPALLPDFGRWLADYFRPPLTSGATSEATPVLSGVIQPGCTLLTMDALVPVDFARQLGGGAAHALATCLLTGSDEAFWRASTFDVRVTSLPDCVAVAPGGAIRTRRATQRSAALPPLRPAALLSTRQSTLRSDLPAAASSPVRARLHGQLLQRLQNAVAGARLALLVPPTYADGCLLLDLEPALRNDGDGSCDAPPRAALLCSDAAIVAEVCQLDGRGGGELLAKTRERRDDVLYCLGAALRRGAHRRIVLAAAAGAFRRGWTATSARLLAALPRAVADDVHEDGELFAEAAHVRRGGTIGAVSEEDGDIEPVGVAGAPFASAADIAAKSDATLLHVAVSCGNPRMVQLALDAAAAAADADADAEVDDASALVTAIGTPLSRGADASALTPLHCAALAMAAAPSGTAAARSAATIAALLTHSSGDAALAWFSDPAPAAIAAGATPAALAGSAGAALTARLAAHVRRVAVAAAEARAASAAGPDPSSPAAAAALDAELRRLLRLPPAAAPPSWATAVYGTLLQPLKSLRSSLGYDDSSERAAFEAHAAAASITSMQAFLMLVLSYLYATTMARNAFLKHPPLSREYLLEHCIGGTRRLVLEDFRQTYYRETNAWLRGPTTAVMCALTLPINRIRTLYVRHHTVLLGVFWVIQFVACQIYLEKLVQSLYDLPVPLVWGCGGNLLQLKVTVLCALVPMRAVPLCTLMILRSFLPFIAPYTGIWFVMGSCANGWLPAAPTNAALTLLLCSLVVWNERRTLRSFRRSLARRSTDKMTVE